MTGSLCTSYAHGVPADAGCPGDLRIGAHSTASYNCLAIIPDSMRIVAWKTATDGRPGSALRCPGVTAGAVRGGSAAMFMHDSLIAFGQ